MENLEENKKEQLNLGVVMDWVACKDEMPIKGYEYLCYYEGNETTFVSYYDGKFGYLASVESKVTHWKELPEPPCA